MTFTRCTEISSSRRGSPRPSPSNYLERFPVLSAKRRKGRERERERVYGEAFASSVNLEPCRAPRGSTFQTVEEIWLLGKGRVSIIIRDLTDDLSETEAWSTRVINDRCPRFIRFKIYLRTSCFHRLKISIRKAKSITVSTRKYSIRAATGHLRNCGFVSQPWLMFLAGALEYCRLPRAESWSRGWSNYFPNSGNVPRLGSLWETRPTITTRPRSYNESYPLPAIHRRW